MKLFPAIPVNLSCTSYGVPQPTLSWYKDGTALSNGVNGVTITNNLNSSDLSVIDVGGQQGGDYNCTASNVAGTSSIVFSVQCELLHHYNVSMQSAYQ